MMRICSMCVSVMLPFMAVEANFSSISASVVCVF